MTVESVCLHQHHCGIEFKHDGRESQLLGTIGNDRVMRTYLCSPMIDCTAVAIECKQRSHTEALEQSLPK